MTIGYHAVSVKTVSKITNPPFYALIVIFGVIINAMILSVRNIEFTKKMRMSLSAVKNVLKISHLMA